MTPRKSSCTRNFRDAPYTHSPRTVLNTAPRCLAPPLAACHRGGPLVRIPKRRRRGIKFRGVATTNIKLRGFFTKAPIPEAWRKSLKFDALVANKVSGFGVRWQSLNVWGHQLSKRWHRGKDPAPGVPKPPTSRFWRGDIEFRNAGPRHPNFEALAILPRSQAFGISAPLALVFEMRGAPASSSGVLAPKH